MTTMTTLHAATSHGWIPRTHCVIATKQVGLLTSPRLNVHRAGDALDNGQNWQIPCWMASLDLYLASLISVSISHTHKPAINNIHIQTRNNPSMSGKSQMTKSDASRVQSGQVSSAERETGHDSCSCRCRQAAVKIWDLEVSLLEPKLRETATQMQALEQAASREEAVVPEEAASQEETASREEAARSRSHDAEHA